VLSRFSSGEYGALDIHDLKPGFRLSRGQDVKRTAVAVALALTLALLPAGCGGKSSTTSKKGQSNIFEAAPLKMVRVNDIDIAYKEFGEGEPLVMISGFSATMDIWEPRFLEALAAKYHVIVFDNRGLGKTTAGSSDWTIDLFAEDTAGLIDALGLGKANVLGWSLGGDVALSLVVYHPEKVVKLVSYAGDCGGTQKIDAPPYKQTLQQLNGVRAPGKKFFAALFPADWLEKNPLFIKDFPIPKEHSKFVNIARQNKAYEDWQGVYDQLKDVRRPVLAATGTEDVSTPPGNAMILAARIPGCWLEQFLEGGHGLQYQYPDRFANAIIEFLQFPTNR
jgi:pimeloyl-ACP methyl ester carboxylesterase